MVNSPLQSNQSRTSTIAVGGFLYVKKRLLHLIPYRTMTLLSDSARVRFSIM